MEKLVSSTSPYATFWSGGQKVAINKHGEIASALISQDATYTAQAAEVYFKPNDASHTRTLVMSTSGVIHTPIVEAARSGEFFAVWADWVAGYVYIAVWADITTNTVPVVKSHAQSGLSGKSSIVWDEARRAILFMNNGNGKLLQFSDTGDLVTQTQIFSSVANSDLQRAILKLTPQGWLAILACTADPTLSPPHYRTVLGCWTATLEHFAPLSVPLDDWTGFSSWATLPVSVGTGEFWLGRSLESDWNTLTSAFFIDDKHIHIAYSSVPAISGKFVEDQGRNASMIYQRFDTATGRRDIYRTGLNYDGFEPWMPGSFITRRGDTLYHLILDNRDLVVSTWKDGEPFWKVKERHTIAADGKFCQYLNCWRGDESDDTIEGSVTVVDTDIDGWFAGTGYPNTSTVYRFTLPV